MKRTGNIKKTWSLELILQKEDVSPYMPVLVVQKEGQFGGRTIFLLRVSTRLICSFENIHGMGG